MVPVPDCDACSTFAMATFASACISSSSASIDQTISTTISPKRAAFEWFVVDVDEDEGKPSRTDRTNARKVSAVSVSFGDHVRRVEQRRV